MILRILAILALACRASHAQIVNDDGQTIPSMQPPRCWEQCFQIEDCDHLDHLRPAYNDFFMMGMEALRLKNMYQVNGTALLFDTTLSQYHDPDSVMDSEESATKIFKYQKDLAGILSIMLSSSHDRNPLFIAQFDEEKGWSCDTWNCLSSCQAAYYVDALECMHTDATSYKDNNIEPACRVADHFMKTENSMCFQGFLQNQMAIAFVNSDFDHNVEKVHHNHDDHRHYSSCKSYFPTRMVVGTHAVDGHEMDSFQSPDAHYIYIRDNDYTFEAADTLRHCMRAYCCNPVAFHLGVKEEFHPEDNMCMQATEDYSVDVNTYSFMWPLLGNHVQRTASPSAF